MTALPLHSSTFRLALIYMALFGGSVLILLGFIYWSTAGTLLRQVDATIEAEIAALAEGYRSDGLTGLSAVITRRVSRRPGGSGIYLLTTLANRPVVGNLDRWPAVEPDVDGWLNFRLDIGVGVGGEPAAEPAVGKVRSHPARARSFLMPGGFKLLVGRDIHDLEQAQQRIINALVWGLLMTLVLALIGGVMMSRSTARRIEAITRTSRRIMAGDLSRRIPLDGSGDDFDRLAASLNAMLERIETLMEELRRVSDNIAHDLRTPLTRLKGELEQLEQATTPPAPQLRRALAEADGLLATFGALMRIARIESGARRAGFAEVDLAAVASDVVDLYRALAEDQGQLLTLRVDGAATIVGDRDLLFQALANLLDNAIKFSPAGSAIALGVRRVAEQRDGPKGGPKGDDLAGGFVEVTVADAGPGVPEAARGQVLERFFRLDSSRGSPGNGLGLSLVVAVTKLHQAQLLLSDNRPGLRVSLRLPTTVSD